MNVITVTQLSNFIKAMFESETLLFDIRVKGEVTNVSYSQDAVYFSLKDETCQIACFAFGSVLTAPLKNGDLVTVTGRPQFLPRYGKVSFTVKKAEKANGQGEAYVQYLLKKERLEKEGCFRNHRTLKRFPRRIGVVSSPNGAVIHDMMRVIQRRNPALDIVLFPARVQGDFAEAEILRGIRWFSEANVDAVVVARGGGSEEDLSVFNSEEIVRATYACKKPVVSAVGHETNFTLIDYAADVRASTPSVAAELITATQADVQREVLSRLMQMRRQTEKKYAFARATAITRLRRAERGCAKKISERQNACVSKLRRMQTLCEKKWANLQRNEELTAVRLDASNPLRILRKGFVAAEKDALRITSVTQLRSGEDVRLYFADGTADARINNVKQTEKKNGF